MVFFSSQHLALNIDRDLLRQVALGHRRGDLGDIADLVGQVAREQLTLSVRSFQVPETSRTSACPPSLPSVPTSLATRVTSAAKMQSWSTMVLIVSLRPDLAFDSTFFTGRRWPPPW